MKKTKFEKAMEFYNDLKNQVEHGSKEYQLLCRSKYRYIEDYNVCLNKI